MTTYTRKRKLSEPSTQQAYYAVRTGHKPGVYMTWNECNANVTGFRGSIHKKFATLSEARDFVAGKSTAPHHAETASQAVGARSGGPAKFYGVAVGHRPGVYTTWGDAQLQILNVKGPRYKKFSTRSEAEDFVRSGGKTPAAGPALGTTTAAAGAHDDEDDASPVEPPAKKSRIASKLDDAGTTSSTTTADTTSDDTNGSPLAIWTDGSSRANGQRGAVAGIGVWFGAGDARNLAEPLAGTPQTNNRAELTAIIRALEVAPRARAVRLHTDSNYAIQCLTTWYAGWVRKGWVTAGSSRRPVENRDLIERARALIDERDRRGAHTDLVWVKGHAGDVGNQGADALANQGALMPRRKL